MSDSLEQAIEALRKLLKERQEELVTVLRSALDTTKRHYTEDQLLAIDEGIADANSGRFEDEDKVQELFTRYRTS